jgi:hypothetical protein
LASIAFSNDSPGNEWLNVFSIRKERWSGRWWLDQWSVSARRTRMKVWNRKSSFVQTFSFARRSDTTGHSLLLLLSWSNVRKQISQEVPVRLLISVQQFICFGMSRRFEPSSISHFNGELLDVWLLVGFQTDRQTDRQKAGILFGMRPWISDTNQSYHARHDRDVICDRRKTVTWSRFDGSRHKHGQNDHGCKWWSRCVGTIHKDEFHGL